MLRAVEFDRHVLLGGFPERVGADNLVTAADLVSRRG